MAWRTPFRNLNSNFNKLNQKSCFLELNRNICLGDLQRNWGNLIFEFLVFFHQNPDIYSLLGYIFSALKYYCTFNPLELNHTFGRLISGEFLVQRDWLSFTTSYLSHHFYLPKDILNHECIFVLLEIFLILSVNTLWPKYSIHGSTIWKAFSFSHK